jgi:hypothetical protein
MRRAMHYPDLSTNAHQYYGSLLTQEPDNNEQWWASDEDTVV